LITRVEGEVAAVSEHTVTLVVDGIGIDVLAGAATIAAAPPAGARWLLYTHLQIRDEVPVLFGFHRPEQKRLFLDLIQVNGVGPRLALNIVGGLPLDTLVEAIRRGDAKVIQSAPGVGKKIAERIVLELAGRLPDDLGATSSDGPEPPAAREALSALLSLGFREPGARTAVREALAELGGETDPAIVVRKALGKLGRAR
jgi:Holliday junction DNA helicase RuvA